MTVGELVARRPGLVRLSAASTELAFMGALFVAYKAVRLVADDNVDTAVAHALWIRHVEKLVGLPSELDVQRWMLSIPELPTLVNTYYAYAHFPATIAFLVWTYWARPELYKTVRAVIIMSTAASLVVHLSYPLAPARMLTGLGFVDVGKLFGPDVYGAPGNSLANQYAAMPSLHVSWAVLVAVGMIMALRTRWRWLFVAHPLITVFVVVSAGHHYWLDGIVAVALLGAAFVVAVPGRVPPLSDPSPSETGAAAP